MLIENRFEVAAPVDTVWSYLLDVPNLVPCLPGAELVGQDGSGGYQGRVTTRMGPVSMRFSGTATIVESDQAARRIVLVATGSEEKGKGTASMTVTSTLAPVGAGTRINVAQDVQVSGAAAQYGSGMIADVSSVLMKQFATCLQHNIDAAGRGEAPAAAGARPASGLRIALAAALLALRRVFARLFGRGGNTGGKR